MPLPTTIGPLGLALLLLGGASGCVIRTSGWVTYTAPRPVVVAQPPPPVRVEVQSPATYEDGVWITGHWEWRGSRYIWVPGRWERPHHGYLWVAPRYVRRQGGWVYLRGHWRPGGAVRRAPRPPRRQRVTPPPPAHRM